MYSLAWKLLKGFALKYIAEHSTWMPNVISVLTAYRTGAKGRPSPIQNLCFWQPNTVLIGEFLSQGGEASFTKGKEVSIWKGIGVIRSQIRQRKGFPLVCVSTPFLQLVIGTCSCRLSFISQSVSFSIFIFLALFNGYAASPNLTCEGEWVFYCSYDNVSKNEKGEKGGGVKVEEGMGKNW